MYQSEDISLPPKNNSPQTYAAVWLVSGIRFWSLLALSLHLAAFYLPEPVSWSVWPYTFFPPWLAWGLAVLAAGLTIPAVASAVGRRGARLLARLRALNWPAPRWWTLVSLLAGLLFWTARLRHLRWGDAYMLSVALSYPDLNLRVVYNWQAPLTVFLHQRLWQFAADPLLGWPVETVYAAVSIGCGVVFVWLLLAFSARLGRTFLESAVIAGLVLTTGAMQLFFGYVENYTIISVGLLVTAFLAWRALEGEIAPRWPVLALSLTNAFHPSTVFLWPAMVLLVWRCWRRGFVRPAAAVGQLVWPPVLVAGGVLALMESGGHGLQALLGVDRPGGGDGIWFVPLFETTTRWQHYTMFSAAHLLDWLNIHFLASPFGLPLVGLVFSAARRFRLTLFTRPAERDFALFLTTAAGMYVLLTWLWNPDYGGQKDWDLFAPSAFVYTLLAGFLLTRFLHTRRTLLQAGLPAVGVSLVHTAAWIFTNTHYLPHD
ncbi:MAG: hypothetical protein D6784_06890 [Chloroflexi bacterium]|nr:MAG: hypothetical protein D6784_06890 [Chloroflexota bacterium]